MPLDRDAINKTVITCFLSNRCNPFASKSIKKQKLFLQINRNQKINSQSLMHLNAGPSTILFELKGG